MAGHRVRALALSSEKHHILGALAPVAPADAWMAANRAAHGPQLRLRGRDKPALTLNLSALQRMGEQPCCAANMDAIRLKAGIASNRHSVSWCAGSCSKARIGQRPRCFSPTAGSKQKGHGPSTSLEAGHFCPAAGLIA